MRNLRLTICDLRFEKPRRRQARILLGVTLFSFLSSPIYAQYQKTPPDFGGSYSFPTPAHPEPSADWLRLLDVGLLALALAIAGYLVFRNRSRKGIVLLSAASVAYFGFFRKGCLCSVGAIQNAVLCLVNPQYVMSMTALAIFFLPLLTALFFGRIFCSGVCPLGAIQDLVVIRPLRVPIKLDRILRSLQFIYLGLAIFFAGWALNLKLGAWNLKIGQHFLICEWDPFVPIFRRSGPFYMVLIAAALILAGMFIGRPYCRWLCPYGGILSLLSRVSWKNVSITPDKELDCGLCTESCPYGAIDQCRADRAHCVACTRCYADCPRHKRLVALKAGPQKPVSVPAVTKGWQAVVRTWAGVIAALIIGASVIWMLSYYVQYRRVYPAEKALIESLKEKARNDAEIQKILQPEFKRQHEAAVVRRHVYDRGGEILIFSAAALIAWLSWFRPKQGAGAGFPAEILRYLEKPPERRRKREPRVHGSQQNEREQGSEPRA
jgi:polyferredoxin